MHTPNLIATTGDVATATAEMPEHLRETIAYCESRIAKTEAQIKAIRCLFIDHDLPQRVENHLTSALDDLDIVLARQKAHLMKVQA